MYDLTIRCTLQGKHKYQISYTVQTDMPRDTIRCTTCFKSMYHTLYSTNCSSVPTYTQDRVCPTLQTDMPRVIIRCSTCYRPLNHVLQQIYHPLHVEVPLVYLQIMSIHNNTHNCNTQKQVPSLVWIQMDLIQHKSIDRWYQILASNVHHTINAHCLTTINSTLSPNCLINTHLIQVFLYGYQIKARI